MITRELPLHDTEFAALLQSLRRNHFKWDIYADGKPTVGRDAIILEPEEHQFLVATARALWSEINALERGVVSNHDQHGVLGVPDTLQKLIRRSTDAATAGPRSVRIDFHYTVDKEWVAVECNSDLPGGVVEMAGMGAELSHEQRNVVERFGDVSIPGDLAAAFQRAFATFSAVGLVYDTTFSIDLQQIEYIRRWLEQSGHTVVIGGPETLAFDESAKGNAVGMKGVPLHALYRFYPAELIGALPNATVWQAAAGELPCCNPLSAGISQSKRLLALHDPETSPAIHEHMPRSVLPEHLADGQLAEERERWVVKTAYGRMGDGIAFGVDYSPDQWQKIVAQVYHTPTEFVVQERFDSAALWFSGSVGYPVVGVHVVDGEFAGYFSRYDSDQIIRDGAKYVPTMVRFS